MKKLSFLFALIFTFCVSTPVFAANPTSANGHYKIIESHQQVKDKVDLIKLSIQQRTKSDKSKSFNSKQLLEKRQYDDGTIEEYYTASSLAVIDENKVQVDASQVVNATASGYTYADGTKSTSGLAGSVSVAQTLYYTVRVGSIGDIAYRINYEKTVVMGQNPSNYCSYVEHGIEIAHDYQNDNYYTTTSAPVNGQLYTVYSGNSNFYLDDAYKYTLRSTYTAVIIGATSPITGTINVVGS